MVYSGILWALSIMSFTRSVGSRLELNNFRFNLMTIFRLDLIYRNQIGFLAELAFYIICEINKFYSYWLTKLHNNVNITFIREIIPNY